MNIPIKVDKDFEHMLNHLIDKYGEGFEYLNGFHETQLNFSDFINGFVDKNVADVTIDANANASHKDIVSLNKEKNKSHDKLFAFNKIFYEMKKKYGLNTARKWLEDEYNGAYYLHDASSSSYIPYCFTGDTTFMTDKGIKRLDECVGKDLKVINKNHGWEDATVRHFGQSQIMELTLERYGVKKVIHVTPNHKWYIKTKKGREIVTTEELEIGDKIPFNTTKTWSSIEPSPFGIAHGFYIGDGDKGIHGRANFCGDKKALIPYFTPAKISGTEQELTIAGIPESFRELPSLTENKNYLYGWLVGYFAADGNVDNKGRCTIASTKIEYLERVRDILCILGMPTNRVRYQDRVSNLTGEMGRVYILTISTEYLTDNFFIRPTHRENYLLYKRDVNRKRSWIVKEVEYTDRVEDVYCVVAEETHTFTLDENVLTHNCYAYDLTKLATEGLFFLKNNSTKYNNQAPKHLTTFTDDVIEFISYMCNRSSGAVGIPNILIWTFYFWKKDCETGHIIKDPDYYIRQTFQKFIYRLNQPFLRKMCAIAV